MREHLRETKTNRVTDVVVDDIRLDIQRVPEVLSLDLDETSSFLELLIA